MLAGFTMTTTTSTIATRGMPACNCLANPVCGENSAALIRQRVKAIRGTTFHRADSSRQTHTLLISTLPYHSPRFPGKRALFPYPARPNGALVAVGAALQSTSTLMGTFVPQTRPPGQVSPAGFESPAHARSRFQQARLQASPYST